MCCAFWWLLNLRRKQIQALNECEFRINGHTQISEDFETIQEKLTTYCISTECLKARGRRPVARVAVYCGSRSKIEAIVGWQNISFCLFIFVIISKLIQRYSYSMRPQFHFTSSVLFNLDRLHSETAAFFLISSLIRFYYEYLQVIV